MNTRMIAALGIVALLGSWGCADRAAQAQAKMTKSLLEDTTRPVETLPVIRKTIVESVEITGQIATTDDVTVGAQQPGRLVAVYVRDGDSVKAGQVVATQDTSDLDERIRQAQSQVNAARAALDQAATNARVGPTRTSAALRSAEAQLRQAKILRQKLVNGARPEEVAQAAANEAATRSNMETAKKELDRAKGLFEAGAVSQQRLDAAQNQFRAAQSQHEVAAQSLALAKQSARSEDLASAEEQIRQAEEAVRSAKAQQQLDPVLQQQVAAARANLDASVSSLQLQRMALEDLRIRSPFSGRVAGQPAQPGTYLGPGTPVVRLVGEGGNYFEAEVPESNIAQIRSGTAVEVYVDATGGVRLGGRVAAVSPLGDNVGRLFRVRVLLEGDLSKVRPGMFARGMVVLRTIQDATVVPAAAILREGENAFVFVESGGKVRRVQVQPGLREGDLVQVTGVGEGEAVVVRGQNLLTDGTRVLVEKKG